MNRFFALSLAGLALAIFLVSGCLGSSSDSTTDSSTVEIFDRPAWQLIYTDVDFAGPSLGLISGWQGVLLRSVDAGRTWTQSQVGMKADLNSVAILDSSSAIAVGSGGNILRSSDAGQTWTPVDSSTIETLSKVVSVNSGIAVAVGWHGTILRTQDSGKTWSRQFDTSDPSLNFESVDFTASGVGIAVSSTGRVFKSSDGALTWNPLTMPQEGMKLFGASLLDENNALVTGTLDAEKVFTTGGKSILMRTVDGGDSWKAGPREMITDFLTVRYLAPRNAIAGGWGGELWNTMDGGDSWQKLTTHTTEALRSIAKADETTIVAVGDGRTIIASRDGGLTWDKISGS